MAPLLLRIGKGNTSWKGRPIESILSGKEWHDKETGDLSLRPSVYAVEAQSAKECRETVIQIHAEHAVSFLNFPEGALDYDFSLFVRQVEIAATPGSTEFQFSNAAHRELMLESVDRLQGLIEQIRRVPRCGKITLKGHLLPFIKRKFDQGDTEWVQLLQQPQKHRWLALCSPT